MTEQLCTTKYVKCRVCGCGMRRSVADDHIRKHMEAGDLIRYAHKQEIGDAE